MSVPVTSMPIPGFLPSALRATASLNYQLTPEELVQDTLRIGEGFLSDTGALVVSTGEFTGRTPKDKFTVRESSTASSIDWNEFNNPIEPSYYQVIYDEVMSYVNNL